MTKRVKVKLNIKPQAIICDVDGTVALMHGNRTPFEWDKVSTDKPNQWVIDLIVSYHNGTGCKVFFLSGRSDECMDDTHKWLLDNVDVPFDLFMRPLGQLYEKDAKVKYEIYTELIKPQYDVQFVIDDRQQVVDMWRNVAGLPVAQVAEGNF
jgi:acid phosphatase class B